MGPELHAYSDLWAQLTPLTRMQQFPLSYCSAEYTEPQSNLAAGLSLM
jgi:hypothetical protein